METRDAKDGESSPEMSVAHICLASEAAIAATSGTQLRRIGRLCVGPCLLQHGAGPECQTAEAGPETEPCAGPDRYRLGVGLEELGEQGPRDACAVGGMG